MEECWSDPCMKIFLSLFVDSCWLLQVLAWLHFLLVVCAYHHHHHHYRPIPYILWTSSDPLGLTFSETLNCLLHLSSLSGWWTDLSQNGTNQYCLGATDLCLACGHKTRPTSQTPRVLASLATSQSDGVPYLGFEIWLAEWPLQGPVETVQRHREEFLLWLSRLWTQLVSIRIQVWFLASLIGLRIRHCFTLQHRSQMWLGSCVAVAVA